uniref:Uncharacterized protein n=1 Tax=Anguilla anguilla TaxID=7936 RepID=A0A0E9QWZ0_ANGAN
MTGISEPSTPESQKHNGGENTKNTLNLGLYTAAQSHVNSTHTPPSLSGEISLLRTPQLTICAPR